MKNKTKRKIQCHPKMVDVNGDSKNQCYPDELNHRLKKIWNKKYGGGKTKKIYSDDSNEIKKQLYHHNHECDNDVCILKNVLPCNEANKHLTQYYAPFAKWNSDPQKWLNTNDIESVLIQYEDVFPSFNFLGVCPIDWETRLEDKQECICKKICELDLQNEKIKGFTKVASVFNLDEHDEPGSHWVAIYIDILSENMYYFDSEGLRCPTRIKKIFHNLKNKPENRDFNFYSNYNVTHQKSNNECGMYCIYFILYMIKYNDFKHFINPNALILDEEMQMLRTKYFNVL